MTIQEIVLSVCLLILSIECVKILISDIKQSIQECSRSIRFWLLKQKNKRKRKE